MTDNAINYLNDAINKAINYCRDEFDMTYAEAVGILEIKKAFLIIEAMETDDKEDED